MSGGFARKLADGTHPAFEPDFRPEITVKLGKKSQEAK